MLIPTVDPIGSLFVVVGVFIYYALKGDGKKKGTSYVPKSAAELQEEEWRLQDKIAALYEARSPRCYHSEYSRYIVWLYTHRDGMRPKTIEEVVEEYAEKRRAEKEAQEQKNKYEWWLYKHSDEYEKNQARLERCLNRYADRY